MRRWLNLCRLLALQTLLWFLATLSGWTLTPVVLAQGIESILAPGKLIQPHAKWENDCAQCHVKFDRKAQDGLCMSCHKDIGADVRAKTGFHGRIKPQACNTCHTDHKGRNAQIVSLDKKQFDHKQTDFALRGKHQQVECEKCHGAGKKYRDAPADCIACHRKDDAHKGALGAKCADCHTESSWKETRFDHDKTRFALTGKHADVKCASCHRNNIFKDTPRTCIACHRKDDKHKESLGRDCGSCHSERGWKEAAKFNHDQTSFPLLGKHLQVDCKNCHKSTMFKEAPKDCIACHKKDDRHVGTLGTNCADCHTERSWKTTAGRFDHDRTRFSLRNAHSEKLLKCSACHQDPRSFRNTPLDCYSCHKKNDKHEGQLGRRCEQCHNDNSWKVEKFDHSLTRFPLTGRHLTVTCKNCHPTTRFKEASRDCYACHKTVDKHQLKFGVRCETCHNARGWPIWEFDHDKRTPFRLDGAHRKVACERCHQQVAPQGRNVAPTGTNCSACHRGDDAHDGQFGMRCEQCHVAENWKKIRGRITPSSLAPADQLPTLTAAQWGERYHASRRPPESVIRAPAERRFP